MRRLYILILLFILCIIFLSILSPAAFKIKNLNFENLISNLIFWQKSITLPYVRNEILQSDTINFTLIYVGYFGHTEPFFEILD